ncbi:MAG TPA: alpha-L-arabinofuranosidase C-terminal domain-containing protein [Lacunisphaera sp.]
MLENRSFEDFDLPLGWTLLNEGNGNDVTMMLDKSVPLNEHNPTSLRIDIQRVGDGRVGVINQGFKGVLFPSKDPMTLTDPPTPPVRDWLKRFADAQKKNEGGLAIEKDKTYLFSLYARAKDFSGPITVSLEKRDGTSLASQTLAITGDAWVPYRASLTATATDFDARLVISTKTTGHLWLDQVSLFPADTFNHRPNGLRADLMQMLVDLHPAFVRFPGGSFGEGNTLASAFRWKNTIGDVSQRPAQWNIWHYWTTNGLGYYEYLQMCEDLKAAPLFVINCGIAEKDMVDLKDIGPWVDDAMDAIEYANGPATSTWGAQRAAAGHPAPFDLKLLEIGNENGMSYPWGGGNAQQYAERYRPFYDKVHSAHPEVLTIATAPIQRPPINAPVEVLDEHYYPTAEWFEDHANMYDHYDRKGPRIYVGEYATREGAGNGNLRGALGEAAFMTGMERNSDVVVMSSYAPLFVNPAWRTWNPNLIVFDNHRAYGTPSYYNQLLFATNRPDVILPIDLQQSGAAGANTRGPLFAVAGKKNDTGEVIVKVVNVGGDPKDATIALDGIAGPRHASATVLTSDRPEDENSFDAPMRVAPKAYDLGQVTPPFSYRFAPYSVTVLRVGGGG